MAFRPRKRARPKAQRINSWPSVDEKAVLGFVGYKVGMTTVSWIEQQEGPRKGMEVVGGATVVEAPPLKVYGVRFFKGPIMKDVLTEEKDILEKLGMKNVKASSVPEGEFKDVRLLAYAQPFLTTTGKKHVERIELGLGGASSEEKKEYALSLLGKDLSVADVIKEGSFVDIIGVTKGKGWQGPIKRFGVSKQRRKATGKQRHVGTLGPFKPGYVQYTAPQAGQMGLHKRTELNKWVLKVGKAEEAKDINPSAGWPHYGLVKNDFILIKGSVPGPAKRVLRFRWAARKLGQTLEPKLTFVSRG